MLVAAGKLTLMPGIRAASALVVAVSACDLGSVGAFDATEGDAGSTSAPGATTGRDDDTGSTRAGTEPDVVSTTTGPPETTRDRSSSGSTDPGLGTSTTGARACPNGTELENTNGVCVSDPEIIDPTPAYDIAIFGGLAVATDDGVAQYRFEAGELQLANVLELPAAVHELRVVSFFQVENGKREVRRHLLASIPDADRLAFIGTDGNGDLSVQSLFATGARPMGLGFFFLTEDMTCVTVNEADGTLSLFTQVGLDAMVPAGTWTIGGTPRSITRTDAFGHPTVLDVASGTLTRLELGPTSDGPGLVASQTYPAPAGTVWADLFFSDTDSWVGALSRTGNTLTLVNPDDGAEVVTQVFVGGPTDVVVAMELDWPDGALDSTLFWTGLVLQTDASMITVGMHGDGRGGPEFEPRLGSFSTAEQPVALAHYDANGDGRRDFVTASPLSGLGVVYIQ